MWSFVSVIAAVIVALLLFELLDVAEILKKRLRGEPGHPTLEERVRRLEEQVEELRRR